jgi:hypothetical protein
VSVAHHDRVPWGDCAATHACEQLRAQIALSQAGNTRSAVVSVAGHKGEIVAARQKDRDQRRGMPLNSLETREVARLSD